KANSAILTDTLFSDPAVLYAGDYEYMVKAVKLKLNSSGSFYNESLGTTDSITIAPVPNALAVMLFEEQVKVFPNPTFGEISVYSSVNIEQVTITDIMGREVLNLLPAEKRINLDLYQLRKGLYIASVKCEKDVYRTIKIVLH
ncbi:MAG TPA: T9SS type A sorting domain-containing protein, partial [Flavobacteriales bacterium]|nr:T9SS type A sorting domain-containing protein [Flavobacteriales bacterium]